MPRTPTELRPVKMRTSAVVALALPAPAQEIACRDPLKPMLRAELLFGRHSASAQRVSERQWRQFLAREITPRFPDGLTRLGATRRADAASGAAR